MALLRWISSRLMPQAHKACGFFAPLAHAMVLTAFGGVTPDWTETGIMGRHKRR